MFFYGYSKTSVLLLTIIGLVLVASPVFCQEPSSESSESIESSESSESPESESSESPESPESSESTVSTESTESTESPTSPTLPLTATQINSKVQPAEVYQFMLDSGMSEKDVNEVKKLLMECWNAEKELGMHAPESTAPSLMMPLIGGDMVTNIEMVKEVLAGLNEKLGKTTSRRRKRKMSQCSNLWPTNIAYSMSLGSTETAGTLEAIGIYEETTCLNFVQSNQPIMRFVSTSSGCFSFVCRQTASQTVNIGNGCSNIFGRPGIPWHEIAHALGVVHEQSRPDRNTYVTVGSNIQNGAQNNFQRCTNCLTTVPFDFGSVMHYGPDDFSNNGQDVLIAKSPYEIYQNTMGSRIIGPAFYDTKSVNNRYCPNTCSGSATLCLNNGYRNPADCSTCNCPRGLGGDCTSVEVPVSGCGGELTAETPWKNVQSSVYKIAIGSPLQCAWKITAQPGQTIEFQFDDVMYFTRFSYSNGVSIEECMANFVEVKYLTDLGITGPRFCDFGNFPDITITSETNVMLVLFDSLIIHSANQERGFSGKYRAVGTPSNTPAPTIPTTTVSPTSTITPASTITTTIAPTIATSTSAQTTTEGPIETGVIDCCQSRSGTGCSEKVCEDAICAADSYCCNNRWDSVCANAARLSDSCGCKCCYGRPRRSRTPGCPVSKCQTSVCAADPYCCNNYWDSVCSNAAKGSFCSDICS